MFTLTDKALLDRAARMIHVQARELRILHEAGGWASTEAGRKAKQEYDRLLRDERDMRALGKRLCTHFDVKAAPRQTMEAAPFTGVTPTALRDPTDTGNPELTAPTDPIINVGRAIYAAQKPGFNCPECGLINESLAVVRCQEHDGGGEDVIV